MRVCHKVCPHSIANFGDAPVLRPGAHNFRLGVSSQYSDDAADTLFVLSTSVPNLSRLDWEIRSFPEEGTGSYILAAVQGNGFFLLRASRKPASFEREQRTVVWRAQGLWENAAMLERRQKDRQNYSVSVVLKDMEDKVVASLMFLSQTTAHTAFELFASHLSFAANPDDGSRTTAL